jgi:hypothetical protein
MAPRAKKAEVSEDTSMEDAPPSAQQAQETGDEMQEDPFEEEDGKAEEEEEEVAQRVRIVRLALQSKNKPHRARNANIGISIAARIFRHCCFFRIP